MSITEPARAGRRAASAVEGFARALSVLEDLELWQLGSGDLVQLTQALHRAGTSVAAHGLRAVAEFESRGLAPELGAGSTWAWLTGTLRLGPAAAKRQVALAKAIVECPHTLNAVAGGQVTVEQAGVITKTLTNLPPGLDEAVMVEAEQTMIGQAEHHTPARLSRIGHHLLAVLDPDGTEPTEAEPGPVVPEPYLNYRVMVDGTCEGEFRLDPVTALTFTDLIVLASKTEHPRAGAGRPVIAVTMTLAELKAGLPVLGPDLQTLSPGTIRRMACDAKIIPAVLGSGSEILDLGRTVRTVTDAQLKALMIRDGGCTGPGCTVPAHMTEAHHVQHWINDGPSDIANYRLVCPHHHDAAHLYGWTIENTNGQDLWIPPPRLRPRE